jgi:Fic/DOC family
MAAPNEKLAESLQALRAIQSRSVAAIRSSDLTRTHRERLIKNGFLQEVMKGWYISTNPNSEPGETTPWYASYWDFCAEYLNSRFGETWCLSPEQSLSLHAGNRTVPNQLLVRTPRGGNKPTGLMFNTSIFDLRSTMPLARNVVEDDGLRLFTIPAALVEISSGFFQQKPTDARTILATIGDASQVLALLLDGGHSVIAGRIAGAFRNIGRERIAEEILSGMSAAGYTVRETDPFDAQIALDLPRREASPYASRIRMMWQEMRGKILDNFPSPPGKPNDIDAYMKRVDDAYAADAYHSLSIEGYNVSPTLIERVKSGDWNPDHEGQDRNHRDALAARGYFQAFEAVKKSVKSVLANENPGAVAERDHGTWYRELFAPSVAAGILKPADLAGYRNDRVFIRQSMHVPLSPQAVREAMPLFFEMLENEVEAAVRVVLGHFIFVYIHPYIDGNGRMGRFLMNLMFASGGHPWTIIRVEHRADYMSALEQASVNQDVVPFCRFISKQMEA